eukprot:gene4682-6577_t
MNYKLSYRLPTPKYIDLYCELPSDGYNIRNILQNKIILFSKYEILTIDESKSLPSAIDQEESNDNNTNQIINIIEVELIIFKIFYKIRFMIDRLVQIHIDANSLESNFILPANALNNKEFVSYYGINITKSTQLTVINPFIIKLNLYFQRKIMIDSIHPLLSFPQLSFQEKANKLVQLIHCCYAADILTTILSTIHEALNTSSLPNNFKTKSLLLMGPPGSGFINLIKSVLHKYHCNYLNKIPTSYIIIQAGSLIAKGKEYADIELHKIIIQAIMRQPSVVIFKDLEVLCPSTRADLDPELSFKIISVLMKILNPVSEMECLSQYKVLLVGCVNQELHVNTDILNSFSVQLNVPLPSGVDRRRISSQIVSHVLVSLNASFSETFLKSLEKEMELASDILSGKPINTFLYESCEIINNKISKALTEGDGENTNDNYAKNPSLESVQFLGLFGLEEIKQGLIEMIVWPRKYSQLFVRYNLTAISGILLYGPPGTGKTLIPRILAQEIHGCQLINIKLSSVIKGEVGSSEKTVRSLFEEAKRNAPSVIFIDEFQALFTSKQSSNKAGGDTLSSTLISCFDDIQLWNRYSGPQSFITVIASTNEPWSIDEDFLRPGRLEKHFLVGPLNQKGRQQLIFNELISFQRKQHTACTVENDQILIDLSESISLQTELYTGADLKFLISKAMIFWRNMKNSNTGINDEISIFNEKCILLALYSVKDQLPSVSINEMIEYRSWSSAR